MCEKCDGIFQQKLATTIGLFEKPSIEEIASITVIFTAGWNAATQAGEHKDHDFRRKLN